MTKPCYNSSWFQVTMPCGMGVVYCDNGETFPPGVDICDHKCEPEMAAECAMLRYGVNDCDRCGNLIEIPSYRARGVCCPERSLARDGRCNGCGAVLAPEPVARYLYLMKDTAESALKTANCPCEVMIADLGGKYAVVIVPPEGYP